MEKNPQGLPFFPLGGGSREHDLSGDVVIKYYFGLVRVLASYFVLKENNQVPHKKFSIEYSQP